MTGLLNKHLYVFIILLSVCLIVFSNSINNQFSLIDDYEGFVQNTKIRDFDIALGSFDIQKIIYSLSFSYFGNTPVPLNLFSMLFHTINAFLMFMLFKDIFDKKISFMSSLLFLVHPVVTEPVNWISGIPYLYITFVTLIILILFKFFRKKANSKYYFYSVLLYAFFLIYYRTIWMITIPLMVVVFDYFLLGTKDLKEVFKYNFLLIIFAVFSIFFFYYDSFVYNTEYINRLETVTLNSQSLTPVLQTYPYTVFNMMRLYVFPLDLAFFYDGVPIYPVTYLLMYSSFVAFILLLVLVYKQKKYFGLLMLMIFSILPSFFPVIYVWTMAERYLYRGAMFYSVLLVILLFYLEKRFKIKNLSMILFIGLFLFLSLRTYARNNDWDNPRSFALASTNDSPLSPRSYSDLGALSLMEKDYDTALKYLGKSLEILPGYENAVRNTGLAHLLKGSVIIEVNKDPTQDDKDKGVQYFDYAVKNYPEKTPAAIYYLIRSIEVSNNDDAKDMLQTIIKVQIK
jgi:tetratricopeptide (TPR) repeat protein